MDERRQRALLLFQQGRHEHCERELGRILAADPRDAWAHATLAHCLIARGKLDAADASVRAALEEEPESDYAHKTLARLFIARGQLTDARAAVLEAVRLDPDYAGHRALFGVIELDLGNPGEALRAADEALALDPRHKESLNLRAKALIALGRSQDARAVVEQSLAVDPEHGDTHKTMGAALLSAGDAEGAVACYREALRLDPNSETAREGFLQALKSRHRLYRGLLKFFLWTDRQRQGLRLGVIAAIIIGKNALRLLIGPSYDLPPVVIAVLVALVALLLLTWVADSLFNHFVRFDPLGRHVLTPGQRAVSNYVLAFILLVAGIAIGLAVAPASFMAAAVGAGSLILLPVSVLMSIPRGTRQRRRLAVLTCVAAALAIAAAATLALGGDSRSTRIAAAILAVPYALVCVMSIGLRGADGEDDVRGAL